MGECPASSAVWPCALLAGVERGATGAALGRDVPPTRDRARVVAPGTGVAVDPRRWNRPSDVCPLDLDAAGSERGQPLLGSGCAVGVGPRNIVSPDDIFLAC